MISSPAQKPLHVLQLPPEIRNCIWRHVVIDADYITFKQFMIYPKSVDTALRTGNPAKVRLTDDEPKQTSLLAIAFTCRQLYLEVTPIYYAENTFQPEYHTVVTMACRHFQKFAKAIGPRNAGMITQLHLHGSYWADLHDCVSLSPSLKRLYLDQDAICCSYDTALATSFAKKHMSLAVVIGEEVWGPEKWKMYPE